MHVRFSMCRGMSVVDDRGDELRATVTGLFVHPDLGKIEGLFVRGRGGEEFLAVEDIAHWGRTIVVRDGEVIAPLDERVRLAALRGEGRPVLGQKIVTDGGAALGTCKDVQFETDTFRLEWIFPRAFLRWGRPLPAGAIIEVRPDAVVVRDAEIPSQAAGAEQTSLSPLETA